MKTKLCRKCGLEKNIDDFRLKKDKCGKYYIYSYCKQCEKEFLNKKRKEYDKKYRERHREEINKKARERKKELSSYEKEKRKIYYQTYVKNNKEKLKHARNLYEKKKKQKDSVYKLKCQIRKCIRSSFLKKGLVKSNNTENILGLNLCECYNYLLKTYKENYGTEWDGIEKIHIDHIIPLSIAKTEQEVIKLCHYTNLQLLKAKDNMKKYNKLDWEL